MPYRTGWAALAVTASAVAAAAELLLPALAGRAVHAVTSGAVLAGALTALAGLLVARAVANLVAGYALSVRGAHLTARLRARAARDVLGEHGLGAGDVTTRVLIDAAEPASVLPMTLHVAESCVALIGALVGLTLVHPLLLAAAVVTLGLVTLVLRRFFGDTSAAFRALRAAQAALADRVLAVQRGAASVQASGRWIDEVRRVLEPLPRLRAAGNGLWSAQRRMAWRLAALLPATRIATVVVGAWLLGTGRIGAGGLVSALGYVSLLTGSVDGVESLSGLAQLRVARERLAALGGQPPAPDDPAGETASPGHRGPAVPLPGLDVAVPAGSLVAVVGADAGAREAFAATLATAPGAVLAGPRPAMVGSTVADLIGLGRSDDAAVRAAARAASIADIVERLPRGYDTPVGELVLSGGEEQRLAIAQALAQQPTLLVLSDATSNLDTATEQAVLHALRPKGTAVHVVLTDRASVCARADAVLETPDLAARATPELVLS